MKPNSRIAAFIDQLVQWPCWGEPEYTFSDVERAIQRDIVRLNLVATVTEAAAADTLQRELALLDALEKKYRPGIVIQMPGQEEAAYNGPAEQLPLIA
jgi:hypothetical protein